MKECTQLTSNRPSDSWEKAKKSELEKMATGRGQEERAKDPPTLRPLTLLHVFFPPFPISHQYPLSTVHQVWNRLVNSGPESFFQCRCKESIDAYFGAFDILKVHTHAATIPALARIKRHFFSIFPFAVEESFWLFVFDDGVSSSIETS